MRTELHWIDGDRPGRLALAARPRGGDWLADEVAAWARSGVQTVASLLTPEEVGELDRGDESAECRANGIIFVALPVEDRGVPASREEFHSLVSRLAEQWAGGRTVLIHCRQGIGRAGLTAVGVLQALGVPTADAIERVSRARGRAVPETAAQRRWIEGQAPELSAPVA